MMMMRRLGAIEASYNRPCCEWKITLQCIRGTKKTGLTAPLSAWPIRLDCLIGRLMLYKFGRECISARVAVCSFAGSGLPSFLFSHSLQMSDPSVAIQSNRTSGAVANMVCSLWQPHSNGTHQLCSKERKYNFYTKQIAVKHYVEFSIPTSASTHTHTTTPAQRSSLS
jgi:hypothetical protein